MTQAQLPLRDAQRLAVHAQQLAHRPMAPASRDSVLEMIRRLGCLQIDTIHVVARSPYFVLWSRLGAYDQTWLDELQYPEGMLFEYWAHAASFIPIEHFRLFRPRMLAYAQSETKHPWFTENQAVLEHVLQEIERRGPLGAASFAAPPEHQGGGWWNWKPAKRALDILWTMGELMILRRIKFQRIYQLRERVLPQWSDAGLPSEEQRRRELATLALHAMGIATARQLADYFRMRITGVDRHLEALAAEGLARRVAVEGWSAPAYVPIDSWEDYERGMREPELTTLLSPFDSLIWDRERTRALFGFDYRLECYTPAPKRRYGYFVLPILRRGQLIGRLDAKAERKQGVFRVRAIYLEPGVEAADDVLCDIAEALVECAEWHRTPEVSIDWSDPQGLRLALESAIASMANRVGRRS